MFFFPPNFKRFPWAFLHSWARRGRSKNGSCYNWSRWNGGIRGEPVSPPVKVKTCVRIKQVTILWTQTVVLAAFIVTWEQFLVHDRSKRLNRQRVIESTYLYNMICYDNNVDGLSQTGSADKRYFLLALKQTISLWSFRHFKIMMKIWANPRCF